MSLKKQAINGVVWTFTQQFSVQIVNFVVQIILARLLVPSDFGLIAMLTVFISIGASLMDSGMTSSLIRMKRPDQLDYSTVFVTNMLVSIGIYLIVFVAAPLIAKFYEQEILENILRVFALTFVIRSFVAVHIAKLTKEMNFKTQMKLQVPSTLAGAMTGVYMAYSGYGVWSLVWLNLVQTIVFTIQNWLFIKWKPSLVFNKRRFWYHFNFGYKLTLSSLLDTIYRDIYTVVIGKAFTPTLVGYFNQAETLRKFPVQQLSAVMGKVTYPLFSNIRNDIQLKSAYQQTMRLVFFLAVPMMMILILLGKEVFLILFGEKWLPAVPYFQVLAVASIVSPLSTYNLNVLKVKGRSELFLKLEIMKKTIGFAAVFVAVPFGMNTLVISYMVISHVSVVINMIYSGKLIGYFLIEQLKDISRIYLVGLTAMALTFSLKEFLFSDTDNIILILLSMFFAFSVLYLLGIFFLDKRTVSIFRKIISK